MMEQKFPSIVKILQNGENEKLLHTIDFSITRTH